MKDDEFEISQNVISDISFKEIMLDSKEDMTESEKALVSLLPPNMKVKIYSTAHFTFNAKNINIPNKENKRIKTGDIFYKIRGNKITAKVILGETNLVLSSIDEEYLIGRLKLIYSIETGDSLDKLPLRNLLIEERVMQKEPCRRSSRFR